MAGVVPKAPLNEPTAVLPALAMTTDELLMGGLLTLVYDQTLTQARRASQTATLRVIPTIVAAAHKEIVMRESLRISSKSPIKTAAWGEETLMAKNDGQIVIKKYANRRLYNTGTSTYVTLDDLAVMVKKVTNSPCRMPRAAKISPIPF